MTKATSFCHTQVVAAYEPRKDFGDADRAKRRILKLYGEDTGLLCAHAFADRRRTPDELYRAVLFDKLGVNEGMLVENCVAQQLKASGRRLFFYSKYSTDSADRMEIDFLAVREYSDAGLKPRVSPVEVKSSGRYSTRSLEKFRAKFGKHVGDELVLHPKNVAVEGRRVRLPLYMAHLV